MHTRGSDIPSSALRGLISCKTSGRTTRCNSRAAAAVILGDYDSDTRIHSTHIPRCTSLRAEWVALETALERWNDAGSRVVP